jgi:hypothetical protein
LDPTYYAVAQLAHLDWVHYFRIRFLIKGLTVQRQPAVPPDRSLTIKIPHTDIDNRLIPQPPQHQTTTKRSIKTFMPAPTNCRMYDSVNEADKLFAIGLRQRRWLPDSIIKLYSCQVFIEQVVPAFGNPFNAPYEYNKSLHHPTQVFFSNLLWIDDFESRSSTNP